jgi:hypothetical protein
MLFLFSSISLSCLVKNKNPKICCNYLNIYCRRLAEPLPISCYHLAKVSKVPATSQKGGNWKVVMKQQESLVLLAQSGYKISCAVILLLLLAIF